MSRRRLRAYKLQVRLTRDEHARLSAIVRQERSTQSDVVRAWIGQTRLHGPYHDAQTPHEDRTE